ncbi:MAG: beta strand repeat-containing protein, partial [Plesiomonas sp.]
SQNLKVLANSGTIDLAQGVLNISNGGTSDSVGGLTGAGTLNVTGGTLTLSADNNTLSAATNIASGATVTLNSTGNLGVSSLVDVGGTLNFNGANNFANQFSGAGVINTNAAVLLSGVSTFAGTHNVNADGVLTVMAANNLGDAAATVNLLTNTSQLIFSAVTDTVANMLTGVLDSTVLINNSANMALSGNNSGLNGLINIVGTSTLSVSDNQNLGASAVDIETGSTLIFNQLTGTLNNVLSGAGTWALSGSNVDLINTNANTFLGTVSINNSSTLKIDSANLLNTATIVDIVTGSDTLNINNNGNFVFDNQLIGTGVMNVTTNNNQFSFGANIGNGFTGTVNLFNTQFLLSGDNTTGNTS